MTESGNLRVVHEAYAAFGQGDVAGVLAVLADDVSWHTPGPPEVVPYAGTRTGHDQVAGYFESFGAAVEVTEFEPQEFLARDDHVVVLGRYAFKVKSTGNAVDMDWVHAFTLKDGNITTFRGYEDGAAVVRAFTTKPQSSQAVEAGGPRQPVKARIRYATPTPM